MALRLAYAFDESSGNFLEASGGTAGVLTNGAYVTGHTGNALQNNNGGYATVAGKVSGLAALLDTSTWTGVTIMMWVQANANSGDYTTAVDASAADIYGFAMPSATSIKCWIKTNLGSATNPTYTHGLGSGTWFHVAATWSAADPNIRIFVDGTNRDTVARTGATLNLDIDVLWMSGVPWATNPQNPMDDFRLFDTAESGASITTYMNTPVGAAPDYPFRQLTLTPRYR